MDISQSQINRIEHKVDHLRAEFQDEVGQVKGRLTIVERWQHNRAGQVEQEVKSYLASDEYRETRKDEIRDAMRDALSETFSLKRISLFFGTLVVVLSFAEKVIGYFS